MSEEIKIGRELARSLLNAVEYLALRGDDVGESNVPVAAELRALLAVHPFITALHNNGDLIAAQATIAQQAQMIEHLRGATIPCYTTNDIATADADGFKNGRKSVGLLLGKGFNTLEQAGGKYSIKLSFQNSDDAYAAYTEIATIVRLGVDS
ncbi:hypothetical protein [Pseudomonas sp.]|uniref:hypothetical protein n=1 Tax=Pseudomonas sp. TaxID=306 RepID=UPI003265EE22